MEKLYSTQIASASGNKEITVSCCDVTKLEDVDILVTSAFVNSYEPTPRTLFEALQNMGNENRVAHALGIVAPEADENGDQTAANAEDDLAPFGVGGACVVGRHEDRAEHQTARENLRKDVLAADEGHQRDGADKGDGRVPCNDAAHQQINAAEKQRRGAGFTETAASETEEHIKKRNTDFAFHCFITDCERSRGG